MNKFFRILGLGLMTLTFAFAGFAQDPANQEAKTALYNKYIANYQSDKAAELKVALDAAKEYIAKYNAEIDKEQVAYFKDAIPTLEEAIKKIEGAAVAKKESDEWYAQLKKIVGALNAKNWPESYSLGKQAVDKQFQYLDSKFVDETAKGQKLDIAIGLGVAGFDNAVAKNDTYNNEAVNYLRSAIQQLETGVPGTTYGKAVGYDLLNKENALGLLNYYLGYILYKQGKKDEGLSYYYKATQFNSASKNIPAIYQMIGQKFYDRLAELDKTRIAKTEALKNETTDEAKQKLADEIKAIYAEEKGVAERGIEAYAKAIKAAQTDKTVSQQYKDSLRANLEDLYKFRFENKTDGIDAYINTVASKPLTNPATPVQPVVEEETTESADTTTTSTTPSTKPAAATDAKTNTTAKKPRRR